MESRWYYEIDADGESPMDRAMKCGHTLLTRLMLLQEQEDKTEAPARALDAMDAATYWGYESAVRRLLMEGADPSGTGRNDEPLLHVAVRRGHFETMKLLVEYGADLNSESASGMTAMHWVALNGRVDMAEFLLHHGIETDHPSEAMNGMTPLAVAKLMGYEELADCLAANGAIY